MMYSTIRLQIEFKPLFSLNFVCGIVQYETLYKDP